VRTVDVRCIAATHKDLGQLVDKGLFREDLFFRLDVLRVPVPALHERSDDIPLLVEHFLRKSLDRSPRSVLQGFEPAALDFMMTYRWPGNVRQLENLVERMVVTAQVSLARLADVEFALGPGRDQRDNDPLCILMQKPLPLAELTDRYIEAVLRKVGGSKQKAADLLGVDPSTLYRREKTRD
jgi:two-component system response regulator HydG